jgi:NADH dehydrogenase
VDEAHPDAAGGRRRVVVAGAGFGGLAACEALEGAQVDVLILDRHNYNTFQPLLYQVATAGLSPGDIAYPVRSYVRRHRNVAFREAEVTGVDFDARTVQVRDGEDVAYDFLVIACGAGTNYFGVPGALEHSRAIYTMEDAIAVRDELAEALEKAASCGAAPGDLTVVVVGGGPTGVEMSGTLAELRAMEIATAYPELDPAAASIVLVEQQDSVLGAFHPRLGAYARKVLEDRGVDVRLGEVVAEVTPSAVRLASGDVIACGLVVWAAGIGPSPLVAALRAGKTKGRLEVRSDLRLEGRDDVFVVGDAAAAPAAGDGGGTARLLPQLAQPAIQEGHHAGRQIKRLLDGEATEEFAYHDKGTMATIGRRAAVAELPHHVRLKGTPAWFAWLGLHLVTLLGVRNRLVVLVNWAWRYVSWKRGSKVIAGI